MSDPLIVVCPACQAANRVPAARLDDGGKCGKCGQALFTGAPLELALAGRFAIRSIPTLAIFKRGREVARSSGAMDAGSLIRWIRDKA